MRLSLSLSLTGGRGAAQDAPVPDLDPDTAAYIAAGQANGGGALEPAVVAALDALIVSLKADPSPAPGVSNWEAIKAACILAIWPNLEGQLTPLKGPAPENVGSFAQADVDRVYGLAGDGLSKRLLSRRNSNSDPRNNSHIAVWVWEQDTSDVPWFSVIGVGDNQSWAKSFQFRGSGSGPSFGIGTIASRHLNSTAAIIDDNFAALHGLRAISRGSSSQFVLHTPSGAAVQSISSASDPNDLEITVFGRMFTGGVDTATLYPGRIPFYSIGEHVDTVALNNRLNTFFLAVEGALT